MNNLTSPLRALTMPRSGLVAWILLGALLTQVWCGCGTKEEFVELQVSSLVQSDVPWNWFEVVLLDEEGDRVGSARGSVDEWGNGRFRFAEAEYEKAASLQAPFIAENRDYPRFFRGRINLEDLRTEPWLLYLVPERVYTWPLGDGDEDRIPTRGDAHQPILVPLLTLEDGRSVACEVGKVEANLAHEFGWYAFAPEGRSYLSCSRARPWPWGVFLRAVGANGSGEAIIVRDERTTVPAPSELWWSRFHFLPSFVFLDFESTTQVFVRTGLSRSFSNHAHFAWVDARGGSWILVPPGRIEIRWSEGRPGGGLPDGGTHVIEAFPFGVRRVSEASQPMGTVDVRLGVEAAERPEWSNRSDIQFSVVSPGDSVARPRYGYWSKPDREPPIATVRVEAGPCTVIVLLDGEVLASIPLTVVANEAAVTTIR